MCVCVVWLSCLLLLPVVLPKSENVENMKKRLFSPLARRKVPLEIFALGSQPRHKISSLFFALQNQTSLTSNLVQQQYYFYHIIIIHHEYQQGRAAVLCKLLWFKGGYIQNCDADPRGLYIGGCHFLMLF
jgi:hypothetical protein